MKYFILATFLLLINPASSLLSSGTKGRNFKLLGGRGTQKRSNVNDDWRSEFSHRQTMTKRMKPHPHDDEYHTTTRRKTFVQASAILATLSLMGPLPSIAADQRCDPGDRRCGPDGKLREDLPPGQPIPRVTNEITHVVQITYTVGERREEVGFLRLGLYGKDCPKSVVQFLKFLSSGITSMSQSQRENSIGMQSAPVGLLAGGVVPSIASSTAVEFGVPSQAKAYAAARGMRNAGPDFVPQSRPESVAGEAFPRPHDVAGLVSIPQKGIGYGSSNGDDDTAYASAFLVTADAVPGLDSAGTKTRRVIGQVIDSKSMDFLARLASLPVQKGIAGGISLTQSSGPPLLKVSVQDVGVQRVQADDNKKAKTSKK